MKVAFVKTIQNQVPNMTIGKEYEVIGIECNSYRIISDDWEPYLYEPKQFEVIDSTQPDFWIKEIDEDGDIYAYPIAWFYGCFFEDYFDRKPGFSEKFWQDCKRLYGITKNV